MGKGKGKVGNKHNQKNPRERDDGDGKHGRIGRLDEHTLGYYRRVSDSLNSEFESPEDKEIFVNNVFKQLSEEAIEVSRNQTVSRIVEDLLSCAQEHHLLQFMTALSQDWQTAVTDRFACYVTQTLISSLLPIVHNSSTSSATDEDQEGMSLHQLCYGLCQFVLDNLEEFMMHTYASHIVRVTLELLGGVRVSESLIRSRVSRDQSKKANKEQGDVQNITDRYKDMLFNYKSTIRKLSDLSDHVNNPLSNPVIQTLILVLHKRYPGDCEKFCRKIVKSTDMFNVGKEDGQSVSGLITHEVGSHLIEQVLTVASEEQFQNFYDKYFHGNLLSLAIHPVANFTVQRIVSICPNKEKFEAAFSELSPHLEDIMALNHMGVILRIAESAVRLGGRQDKFLKILLKAFHCYKPEERQMECVPLIASLSTYEVYHNISDTVDTEKDEEGKAQDQKDELKKEAGVLSKVNLHGSILIQNLLKFGNPQILVKSILNLKPQELCNIACDACGSHIMDAFFKSPTIGEKSREAVVGKLKGFYTDLACSKNGSRTLDTIWSVIPLKQKYPIAEELASHEAKIRGDKFGFFVLRNCAINLFIHKKNDWKDLQTSNAKKRKLFSEILDSESTKKTRKM